MVKPSIPLAIAAIFVFAGLLAFLTGMAWFGLASFSLAALAVLLVDRFTSFKVLPTSVGKYGVWLIVIAVVASVYSGSFAAIPIIGEPLTAFMGSLTGTLVPTTRIGLTPGDCANSVTPEVLGQIATVYVAAYDQASNTPFANDRIGSLNYLYQINDGAIKSSIGGSSISNVAGGDVIRVWEKGDNQTSYYAVPQEVCVDKLAKTIEMDVYKIITGTKITAATLQISGYDKTGATALSTGTDTGVEDYDITLGANGEDTFYLEEKVNAANEAFRLYAVTTLVTHDIKSVTPVDALWTEVPTADFLAVSDGIANESSGSIGSGCNVTGGYQDTYVLGSPEMLTEWQSRKYQFQIVAGSTDPTTDDDCFANGDYAILCFLDAAYSRGSDGSVKLNYYQEDSSQGNVGMIEDIRVPLGKDACVVIEGI